MNFQEERKLSRGGAVSGKTLSLSIGVSIGSKLTLGSRGGSHIAKGGLPRTSGKRGKGWSKGQRGRRL